MTQRNTTQRRVFNSVRYLNREHLFWKMPSAWGDLSSGTTILRELWRDAKGAAATSIAPVLGQHAHSSASVFTLSMRELAMTAGVDEKTARKGVAVLEARGFVSTSLGRWDDNPITRWTFLTGLAASRNDKEYFYFTSRLLYGGHWAQMTGPQRQVYLGLAVNAAPYSTESTTAFLNMMLPEWIDRGDIQRCLAANALRMKPAMSRFARVSVSELRELTGLSKSAIGDAVKTWTRHDIAAPIWVYPTVLNGTSLFHFRDHLPPMTFAEPSMDGSPSADVGSSGLFSEEWDVLEDPSC